MANNGKSLKKLIEYDKMLKKDPHSTGLLYQKGIILNKIGDYKNAIETYDLVLEIDPLTPRILYAKGISLFALERYEESLSAYDQVLKIRPHFSDIQNKRNQVLTILKTQKLNEQLKIYEIESEINPKDSELFYNKGNILSKLKKYEEAIKAYDISLKLNLGDAEVLFEKGNALFNFGKYKEAIKIYSEALNIKPDYFEAKKNITRALIILRTTYLNEGKYEKMFKVYNELLDFEEELAHYVLLELSGAISNLINLYNYENIIIICEGLPGLRLGEVEKNILINRILSALSKSLMKYETPTRHNGTILVCEALLKIKPNDDEIKRKIENSRRYPEFHNRINEIKKGTVYLNSGKYKEAFKIYDEALSLEISTPTEKYSIESNIFLALSKSIDNLIDSQNYAGIKIVYKEILGIRLKDAKTNLLINKISSSLSNALRVCDVSKESDKILMICETLMKVYPKDKKTLEIIKTSLSESLNIYEASKEHDKIIRTCGALLKIDSDDIKTLKVLGNSLLHFNFDRKSLDIYEKILALNPTDMEMWCIKGDILSELKMYNEALEAYEKAFDLNSENIKLLYVIGDTLFKIEDYFGALKSYEKALEINPDWSDLWRKKGNVFSKLGFLDEAREAYSKLEELNHREEAGKSQEWYEVDNAINRYHLYR
ncbi:tetratricopeptide repeat protein [Methanosarcina sp. 1.H.A.2.2]|uniref:tetratricopeptide repeat protein n=1 Tax=Methanosarcina sp. 1.H.A.2.2 TaxID=1483601 RepID=UPI0006219EA7|nr:tetratricopeptide repeat protein [Methanosarcina sp. 1.H.A.2.2]KKH46866.1 hypothetical protein EO93_02200 [Methanosarcina sp. 1.H.A.2.2]